MILDSHKMRQHPSLILNQSVLIKSQTTITSIDTPQLQSTTPSCWIHQCYWIHGASSAKVPYAPIQCALAKIHFIKYAKNTQRYIGVVSSSKSTEYISPPEIQKHPITEVDISATNTSNTIKRQ
jgi:hypothetical protein